MSTTYPTPREDEFLWALYRLFYLKNIQFCHRFYSPASISYVRKITGELGKQGFIEVRALAKHQDVGRSADCFQLSRKGEQYLAAIGGELPPRVTRTPLSPYFMEHTLSVNDFLIQLELLAKTAEGMHIEQLRHELTLKHTPDRVKTTYPVAREGGRVNVTETHSYSCDSWVQVFAGKTENAIALELDRGTEEEKPWRAKVRSIVSWIDGPYVERFGTQQLLVAVVVARGDRQADTRGARGRRLERLIRWTELELDRLGKRDRGELFLFTDQDPGALVPGTQATPLYSPADYFLGDVWTEPFTRAAQPLIYGVNRPGT